MNLRGLTQDQDVRFKDKVKKQLKTTSFPSILSQKVDIKKVNLEVMKPWISERVTEILGFEDDICLEFIVSLLEEQSEDPKEVFVKVAGFLEDGTFKFMKQLWELLLSAQESVHGIPAVFVNELKEAMKQKQELDELISDNLAKVEAKESGDRHSSRHHARSRSRDRSRREYSRRSPSRSRNYSRSRSRSRERHSRRSRRDRDDRYHDNDRNDSRERYRRDYDRRPTSRERRESRDDDRSYRRDRDYDDRRSRDDRRDRYSDRRSPGRDSREYERHSRRDSRDYEPSDRKMTKE